jgi:hypothetical protein
LHVNNTENTSLKGPGVSKTGARLSEKTTLNYKVKAESCLHIIMAGPEGSTNLRLPDFDLSGT